MQSVGQIRRSIPGHCLPFYCCQKTQPAHSVFTATTRQESAEETGCFQAETRQQEASIHQWYRQPFRCSGTQFRGSRWEQDNLQRRRSLFSNRFPRTSISQTPRLARWEWRRDPVTPWRETPKTQKAYLSDTSTVSSKTAYSNTCKMSRLGSETCKTPDWVKRRMKSSPLSTERIWRSSLVHLRQYMVPELRNHPTLYCR